MGQGIQEWTNNKPETASERGLTKAEVYSEPCQTYKRQRFVKIVNDFNYFRCYHSGIFIVNFEQISHSSIVSIVDFKK